MKKSDKNKNPIAESEIGYVKAREITEEMQESYIDYAMSVIVARALPDVRDGLKPVHRRILYAMHEDGLKYNAKFRKSANVIGSVLGKYHPHGDMSVYDAMVRMAQDFSFRYPLVDGQGNFGSIDGDSAAAYRYTEARLSRIGEEMLRNIEKGTVDFIDNYDGTQREPTVLPAPFPQLLLNGTLGIAVGMATSIPPHNFSEVVDAAVHIIKNPEATTEDLFEFIKGPDFPTGGQIYNRKEIITAYSQGRGPIVIRGKVDVVEEGKVKQIVITEIPYQVNKSTMIEQFAKLVTDKKIDGIRDIRDESDREGLRITLDLKQDAHPKKIINRLYKFTNLQKTFHLNMIALVDGIQPRTLSLSEVLSYYIDHRKKVIYRRTKFDLDKAKERAHILEGLMTALLNINKCIKIIKESKSKDDARNNLIKTFKLTEIQASAILEIRLHQLAKMERDRIEEELKKKLKEIKELTAILKSPKKIEDIIETELIEAKELFGDDRRTKVYIQKLDEIAEEDLIPFESTIVTITSGGYIKRINPQVYKIQKRGGKGILGMKTAQEDVVEHFIEAKTHDSLLFFTDSGKVFRVPAYEIPEATRVARGRGISNFLEITSQEKVLSVIPLSKEDTDNGIKYLIMGTEQGVVKKTSLTEFKNIRRSGLIAINLKKGDLLKNVCKTTGDNDIVMVTSKGQSIRFREKDVREMGRTASGNRGIKIKKDDKVVGMDVIKNDKDYEEFLLVITENGFGKQTALKEYRVQQRGGSGIKALNVTSKTGNLAVFNVLLGDEEDLIVISRKGHVIKSNINLVPKLSRTTQGVRLMRLAPHDKVSSAICI